MLVNGKCGQKTKTVQKQASQRPPERLAPLTAAFACMEDREVDILRENVRKRRLHSFRLVAAFLIARIGYNGCMNRK